MPSKTPEVVTIRLTPAEIQAMITVALPSETKPAQVLRRLLREAAAAPRVGGKTVGS